MSAKPQKASFLSPWGEFLTEVDVRLPDPLELHCLGGFVLAVVYGLPRPTGDIDLIAVLPHDKLGQLLEIAGTDSNLARKYGICLHYAGSVAAVPEAYGTRLMPVFPEQFAKLRIKALEVHDLVLAKLTRNHPVDIEDVKYLARAGLLDPDVLRSRYEHELRPSLANETKHDRTLALWLSYSDLES